MVSDPIGTGEIYFSSGVYGTFVIFSTISRLGGTTKYIISKFSQQKPDDTYTYEMN